MDVDAATYWLSWVNTAKLIAFALVAVGVAAEFAAEFLGRPLEATIETSRAEAIGRLAIAGANERAAEAQARAAEATLELARFRAPRTLTAAQQERIIGKLKPFAGRQFDIGMGMGDAEQTDLAAAMESVLKRAGWERQRGRLLRRLRKKGLWQGQNRAWECRTPTQTRYMS